MRTTAILLAAALVAMTFAALAPPSQAAGTLRLAVFGDTGTGANAKANVDRAVAEGAGGYVGLGDYNYWASGSTWLDLFRPLTSRGHWMALGNHDDAMALPGMFSDGLQWSRSVNGARIVSINTEARMDVGSGQYNNVRSALCNAAEPTRVLIMHKSWWLGSSARHPGSEFPGSASAMDQLVKDCKVGLVMAGHEHNYQRMMRNGAAYVIVGTGGQSLYPVAGAPSGTVATCSCYGHLVVDVSSGGYSAFFTTTGGSRKDAWSYAASGSSGGSGTPAFSASGGNEWWVQVKVSGASVTGVSVRDTDGGWAPLTYRSWGAWAASYHVQPGHLVQYRATLSSGATVDSCPYTHPGGVAQCGASMGSSGGAGSTFQATFSNLRGNDWWIEANVAAQGGTLARVSVSLDGGAWTALSKTSWGSWARSVHAPDGSSVRFRAEATDGTLVAGPTKTW